MFKLASKIRQCV